MGGGRIVAMAALVLAADQLSKWWVVSHMGLDRLQIIEVAPPWLNFVMAWNTGVNFGVLASDAPWTKMALAAFAAAVAAGAVFWGSNSRDRLFQLGAALLAGGALGNAIDRIRFGAVADFLNMSCCGFTNPFAFNVADVAIAFGALLLVARGGRSASDGRPPSSSEAGGRKG